MRAFRFLAMIFLAVSASATAAPQEKVSDFRAGVWVKLVYHQPLEGVYWTNWYGRLEKRRGAWRDGYFETNDKFVNNGIISFNCANVNSNIYVVQYGGQGTMQRADEPLVVIRPRERTSWANGSFEPLQGEYPPYAFYVRAKKLFC